MATATKTSHKNRKPVAKKKKGGGSWLAGIPFLLGVVASPLAVRAASVLALSGPNALTLLFPFMEIVQSPMFKLPPMYAHPAAQWVMYLQFPLYGLLMTVLLRSRRFLAALGAAVFLHGAAVVAAILLLHAQNPYLNF
jgi:hypothetical protein